MGAVGSMAGSPHAWLAQPPLQQHFHTALDLLCNPPLHCGPQSTVHGYERMLAEAREAVAAAAANAAAHPHPHPHPYPHAPHPHPLHRGSGLLPTLPTLPTLATPTHTHTYPHSPIGSAAASDVFPAAPGAAARLALARGGGGIHSPALYDSAPYGGSGGPGSESGSAATASTAGQAVVSSFWNVAYPIEMFLQVGRLAVLHCVSVCTTCRACAPVWA